MISVTVPNRTRLPKADISFRNGVGKLQPEPCLFLKNELNKLLACHIPIKGLLFVIQHGPAADRQGSFFLQEVSFNQCTILQLETLRIL